MRRSASTEASRLSEGTCTRCASRQFLLPSPEDNLSYATNVDVYSSSERMSVVERYGLGRLRLTVSYNEGSELGRVKSKSLAMSFKFRVQLEIMLKEP